MPDVDTTSLLRRLRALTLADLESLDDAMLQHLDTTIGRLSINRVLRAHDDDDVVVDGSDDEYPATLALDGTDLEIVYNLSDQDLVLRVNKADCQIFRVRLADALTPFPEITRFDFSLMSPDFVFHVGDPNERYLTLARCAGLDIDELITLEEQLQVLGPEA